MQDLHYSTSWVILIAIIKSSTSDNAILAFWLVHCISVTSDYTYVWPYMEINAANAAWRYFFLWEARLRRQKKIGELSLEEMQEITDNAIPVT